MSETSRSGKWHDSTTPIQVQVDSDTTPGIAEYAEHRVRDVVLGTRSPVLHARLRITRYPDPARDRPFVAQANLDVQGRFIRAQVSAPTAREAVDLLHDRLRQRLEHDLQRATGSWEDRRSRRTSGDEHEWRHGDEPTHRPPYFPRPPDEREIVRHKPVTPARVGLDEAVAAMNDLDYDFHFFTEAGSGEDSVLYRVGPTGYRLAQAHPSADELAPHSVRTTRSEQPAPQLSTAEAVARMAIWDQPFLFFLDRERDRGALLYHRYDGHYGLITPDDPGHRDRE